LKVNYKDIDLDEFYDKIDLTEDGRISKTEMKNFLKKLSEMDAPPDIENDPDYVPGQRFRPKDGNGSDFDSEDTIGTRRRKA